MKLQDVLLKAMAKKITWWAAAEIMGVSDRTMRRWREKFETNGYDGLMDQRKSKQASHRVEVKTGRKFCGCIGSDTAISTSGTSTRSSAGCTVSI